MAAAGKARTNPMGSSRANRLGSASSSVVPGGGIPDDALHERRLAGLPWSHNGDNPRVSQGRRHSGTGVSGEESSENYCRHGRGLSANTDNRVVQSGIPVPLIQNMSPSDLDCTAVRSRIRSCPILISPPARHDPRHLSAGTRRFGMPITPEPVRADSWRAR